MLANIYVANVAYVLKTIYISERCKTSYISPRCKPSMWESVKNVKAKNFVRNLTSRRDVRFLTSWKSRAKWDQHMLFNLQYVSLTYTVW